jgi:hypothetical protein
MERIRLNQTQINPEIFPYADSADIFFHAQSDKPANQALYAAIRRWGKVRPCYDRNKQWRGYWLAVQLPERDELAQLDHLIAKWEGTISRVDIAMATGVAGKPYYPALGTKVCHGKGRWHALLD